MPATPEQLARMLARLKGLSTRPDSSVRAALARAIVAIEPGDLAGLPWEERVHMHALQALMAEEQACQGAASPTANHPKS